MHSSKLAIGFQSQDQTGNEHKLTALRSECASTSREAPTWLILVLVFPHVGALSYDANLNQLQGEECPSTHIFPVGNAIAYDATYGGTDYPNVASDAVPYGSRSTDCPFDGTLSNTGYEYQNDLCSGMVPSRGGQNEKYVHIQLSYISCCYHHSVSLTIHIVTLFVHGPMVICCPEAPSVYPFNNRRRLTPICSSLVESPFTIHTIWSTSSY